MIDSMLLLAGSGPAVIEIRDNVVGFDSSAEGDLFLPFSRLHDETAYPGLGIGLATVQSIVERHQKHIRAESLPSQGSSFCFTLGREKKPESSRTSFPFAKTTSDTLGIDSAPNLDKLLIMNLG